MTEKRKTTSRTLSQRKTKAKIPRPPAAGKAVASRLAAKKSAARKPVKRPPAKKSVAAPTAGARTANRVGGHALQIVADALDESKAVNVRVLDVRKLTDVADTLVIASGNSDRHVRSIADRVVQDAKRAGFRPVGVEGQRDGEWVLVDLQDVIVHIMLPRVREFYRLENLWDVSAARRAAAEYAADA